MRIWRSRLPAARPEARFDAVPATVDLSPNRTVAVSQILLAVVAAVFVILFRMELDRDAASSTNPAVAAITAGVPLVVLALGLLAGGRGVFLLLSRREARFDALSVRVTGRTPLGREEWSAPLSAFRGVTWRTVRRRRRRGPPRVFQVIELVHPDASRTIPLHVRQSRQDARAEWESLARALGVPAIDDREGAGHARAAEDLDKSVRDLAAEGKARTAWQPGSEPPAGLSWQSTGSGEAEALVVRLHARRFPSGSTPQGRPSARSSSSSASATAPSSARWSPRRWPASSPGSGSPSRAARASSASPAPTSPSPTRCSP